MVAAKSGAVFLGPEGVGIARLYNTVLGFLRTASSLGISSSGVREVAVAVGSGDQEKLGHAVLVLRKACWATGILGWLLASVFSSPLSRWIFGNASFSGAIALLGGSILLGAIAGGQVALLQGTRRIGDLARINILTGLASISVSIPLYWQFGVQGIVPSIIVSAAFSLAISWHYSRKVPVPETSPVGWIQAAKSSKQLVGLGVAQMWGGLISTLVATAISALIVREFGMKANGFYGAAWSLSGFFANFILGAMGADFYPRLTAVQDDNLQINRLVNEQSEVGILLAVPGIVASMFFAPFAIKLFYTSDFLVAAELLPWFLLGVFCRVVSWPMGFVLLAKGASRWFAGTETFFGLLNLALVIVGIRFIGLTGVAVAFFVMYVFHNAAMAILTRHMTGYRWSRSVIRLILFTSVLAGIAFIFPRYFPDSPTIVLGLVLTIISCVVCVRGLAVRLGPDHRLVAMASNIPGFRFFLTGNQPRN